MKKITIDQLKAELERQEAIKEEAFQFFKSCNEGKCPAYIEETYWGAREKMEEIKQELRRRKMRKTLKRQVLEDIVEIIDHARRNIEGSPDDMKIMEMNSRAMRNLAEAYTLVKRGVMLPDYGREKDE